MGMDASSAKDEKSSENADTTAKMLDKSQKKEIGTKDLPDGKFNKLSATTSEPTLPKKIDTAAKPSELAAPASVQRESNHTGTKEQPTTTAPVVKRGRPRGRPLGSTSKNKRKKPNQQTLDDERKKRKRMVNLGTGSCMLTMYEALTTVVLNTLGQRNCSIAELKQLAHQTCRGWNISLGELTSDLQVVLSVFKVIGIIGRGVSRPNGPPKPLVGQETAHASTVTVNAVDRWVPEPGAAKELLDLFRSGSLDEVAQKYGCRGVEVAIHWTWAAFLSTIVELEKTKIANEAPNGSSNQKVLSPGHIRRMEYELPFVVQDPKVKDILDRTRSGDWYSLYDRYEGVHKSVILFDTCNLLLKSIPKEWNIPATQPYIDALKLALKTLQADASEQRKKITTDYQLIIPDKIPTTVKKDQTTTTLSRNPTAVKMENPSTKELNDQRLKVESDTSKVKTEILSTVNTTTTTTQKPTQTTSTTPQQQYVSSMPRRGVAPRVLGPAKNAQQLRDQLLMVHVNKAQDRILASVDHFVNSITELRFKKQKAFSEEEEALKELYSLCGMGHMMPDPVVRKKPKDNVQSIQLQNVFLPGSPRLLPPELEYRIMTAGSSQSRQRGLSTTYDRQYSLEEEAKARVARDRVRDLVQVLCKRKKHPAYICKTSFSSVDNQSMTAPIKRGPGRPKGSGKRKSNVTTPTPRSVPTTPVITTLGSRSKKSPRTVGPNNIVEPLSADIIGKEFLVGCSSISFSELCEEVFKPNSSNQSQKPVPKKSPSNATAKTMPLPENGSNSATSMYTQHVPKTDVTLNAQPVSLSTENQLKKNVNVAKDNGKRTDVVIPKWKVYDFNNDTEGDTSKIYANDLFDKQVMLKRHDTALKHVKETWESAMKEKKRLEQEKKERRDIARQSEVLSKQKSPKFKHGTKKQEGGNLTIQVDGVTIPTVDANKTPRPRGRPSLKSKANKQMVVKKAQPQLVIDTETAAEKSKSNGNNSRPSSARTRNAKGIGASSQGTRTPRSTKSQDAKKVFDEAKDVLGEDMEVETMSIEPGIVGNKRKDINSDASTPVRKSVRVRTTRKVYES